MTESTDKLKLLRGEDIFICDGIIIHQPSLGEIAEFGEQKFFSTFYSLCAVPSDMKSALWDAGIDYTKISDWSLFIMLSRGFDSEATKLVFGDVDFSKMEMMKREDTGEMVLADYHMVITEDMYMSFIPYLRDMIGYVMKREIAVNSITKKILIEEDRVKRNTNQKEYESTLLSILISLVNTEEFAYKYSEAFDLTIYQLMKSYYQIQNKKSACALYQGSMSGFVDTSKINKSSFSWIYDEAKFK